MVDLIAVLIFLIATWRMTAIYLRNHTKYNVAALIIIIILLVISTLDLFVPGISLIARMLDAINPGMSARIWLVATLAIPLCVFFYFPEIKRLFGRLH
jgi:hypothetical protein